MKKIVFFALLLSYSTINSQVGVFTINPEATLDIKALNETVTSTNVDGLLIPRIERQRAQSVTSVAVSIMIYITDETTGTASGVASQINQKGFYYFDGTRWCRFNLSTSNLLDIEYIVGLSANTTPPDYLIPVSGATYNWSDFTDLQVLNSTHPIQFIQTSNATTFTLKEINSNRKFLRVGTMSVTEQSQATALPSNSFTSNTAGNHSNTVDPASLNITSNGNYQHDLNMVSKDDSNFSNAGGQHPTDTNGASALSGTNLNIHQYASFIIGNSKSGIQIADHSGCVKLGERLKSSIITTKQKQTTRFGIGKNLPDATNSDLSQIATALENIGATNNKTINQKQLPNINLTRTTNTDGNHNQERGGIRAFLYADWGLIPRTNDSNATIFTDTTSSEPNILTNPGELGLAIDSNHSHSLTTSSINGKVSQQTLDVKT